MKKILVLLLPLMVALTTACSSGDKLDGFIDEMNSEFPAKIANGMEIVKAYRTPNAVVIKVDVDESILGSDIMDLVAINFAISETSMTNDLIESFKADEKTSEILEVLAEKQMDLTFTFVGNQSGKDVSFSVSHTDL